jgi:hypothetical protein
MERGDVELMDALLDRARAVWGFKQAAEIDARAQELEECPLPW